jgi:hypothetical protein
MRNRFCATAATLAGVGVCVCVVLGLAPGVRVAALAQTAPATSASASAPARASGAIEKGAAVTSRATGTFDVKLTPQQDEGSPLGRLTIDKTFHGGIDGTSQGQMLAATSSSVKTSGGYVALEKVTAKLDGRAGTFFLQHSGTMTRGTPSLALAVVPDSGTEELAGLTGTMTIDIAPDGKHSYTFQYTIAPAPAP